MTQRLVTVLRLLTLLHITVFYCTLHRIMTDWCTQGRLFPVAVWFDSTAVMLCDGRQEQCDVAILCPQQISTQHIN